MRKPYFSPQDYAKCVYALAILTNKQANARKLNKYLEC